LWEGAEKSAKYHFEIVVEKLLLTFHELRTLVCEFYGMLNSQPTSAF